MKHLLSLLAVCLLTMPSVRAQSDGETSYLFEQFQKGRVYYKDGQQFEVLLNLDVYGKRFLFVDTNDDIKEFGEPDMVTLVKIGDRTFLHDKKNIREVLQIQPPILVEYKAGLIDKGKNAGYGGRSSTAAIASYSGIESGGVYHKFKMEDQYVVGNLKKTYYIEIDKKKKRFTSSADFLKIYPKQKETLKTYIKDNNIDFSSTEQVVQLCNYAATL